MSLAVALWLVITNVAGVTEGYRVKTLLSKMLIPITGIS